MVKRLHGGLVRNGVVPGRLGCRAWPTPRASFSVRAPFSLFRSTSGRAPFGHRARTDTVSPFGHRAPCRTPSLEKTGHRSGTVQGVVARCPVPGGCHNLQRTCRRRRRTPRSSCRPRMRPGPGGRGACCRNRERSQHRPAIGRQHRPAVTSYAHQHQHARASIDMQAPASTSSRAITPHSTALCRVVRTPHALVLIMSTCRCRSPVGQCTCSASVHDGCVSQR